MMQTGKISTNCANRNRGRKVTAFGVLFNFTGNAANTTVQPVEDMVKEAWVRIILDHTLYVNNRLIVHIDSSPTL
jgi:hypothetical protein